MPVSEHGLAILKLCVYSRNERLNKYIMDNGYQVSQCSENRVTNMERGENRIKHVVFGWN